MRVRFIGEPFNISGEYYTFREHRRGEQIRDMAVTFEDARLIALSLDNAMESPSYGTPGFKVDGVLFARFHQDGESLVVRTDFEQRAELMAASPEAYYITDHYLNYEWILVRVARVHPDALRDLLRAAWRAAAAKKKARPRRPMPRRLR
jgi:hypothetical protein